MDPKEGAGDHGLPNPGMKGKTWILILCGIVCILILGIYAIHTFGASRAAQDVVIDERALYAVSRVVDGDTFKAKIGRQEITIRMLGINTPETVDPRKPAECYGSEASAETKKLLSGQTVRLEFNPNRERQDKYGRYLLYVYLDDGLFVNEFLVKEGFAREYTYGTAYSFQKEFKTDQLNAKVAHKGLWGACDMKSKTPAVTL